MQSSARSLGLYLCALSLLANPAAVQSDEAPIGAGLQLLVGDHHEPLPLIKTTVRAHISGFVCKTVVTQAFVNPYDGFIEATYVFPLPENAAVNAMVMRLSDREVVAEIKEREEAQRIYEEAVDSGRTAALLNQERPNLFTQKVGNIPAGERIDVELTYIEALPYERGVSQFVFPTVVGPRYIPGRPLGGEDLELSGRIPDTTRVPDASVITPPSFDEGELGEHRIDIEITVDPGVAIRDLSSISHAIRVERKSAQLAVVRNDRSDRVPNKDFILNIDLRGDGPQLAVLTHRQGDDDGYVTVAMQPPALPAPEEILPKDLFFVLDTSGSMSGLPIDASKALVIEALRHLNSHDRFSIMRFSDDVSSLSSKPLPNTPQNVARGIAFIESLEGEGGTEMLSGIEQAIAGRPAPGRVRIVFFLTDGYIGNDDEIIAAIAGRNEAQARIFSLGVGSSVNRSLLSNMARVGRGRLQVMRNDQEVEPFVRRFYDQVRSPVLTDVTLEWQGLDISDQTPAMVPDLFDGQPLIVHARYENPGRGRMVVSGKLGGKPWRKSVSIDLPAKSQRPAIANLWARDMIRGWSDEESSQPGSRRDEIVTLALGHNLLSQYTSFVAVDQKVQRPASEPLIPVAQRLPLPEGVSRNALGDLSRQEIPPGDPFIVINAPADARRVTAFFPFGLIKDLAYDDQRGSWRGRFLVPAGIPDGYYTIVVAIESHNGLISYHEEAFHLDSAAQEMIVDFEGAALRAGKSRLFKVDTIEPAAEVYLHCETLGWNRVSLIPVTSTRAVRWHKWLKVKRGAALGEHHVLVVMRDLAGNRIEQTVVVTVNGVAP